VTFGEQSTDEMMFGMFEFIADEGVAPKPVTLDTRIDALHSTLPKDSSYKVTVTLLPGRQVPSILHLPKTGEGTWYIAQSRLQINVVPIRQIAWNGDAFQFQMDLRLGFRAAFTLDVSGEKRADGTIQGQATPVGAPNAPFSKTFEGALRR
jgi:hypothetical protein